MHNTGHILFISKYYSSLGQCYFSHLFCDGGFVRFHKHFELPEKLFRRLQQLTNDLRCDTRGRAWADKWKREGKGELLEGRCLSTAMTWWTTFPSPSVLAQWRESQQIVTWFSFPLYFFCSLFIFQIRAFPEAPASWAQEEGESKREVLLLKTYS